MADILSPQKTELASFFFYYLDTKSKFNHTFLRYFFHKLLNSISFYFYFNLLVILFVTLFQKSMCRMRQTLMSQFPDDCHT